MAERTGIAPVEGGSIERGVRSPGWRTVTSRDRTKPYLPFFIQYHGDPASQLEQRRTSYAGANSPARPGRFSRIELSGEAEALAAWLGSRQLRVAFVDGPPGVRSVRIASAAGDIELR